MSAIKALRRRQNLTQAELAHSVGVTEETISNWENGRRGVEWIERVARLCEALECSPRDLLSFTKKFEQSDEGFDEKNPSLGDVKLAQEVIRSYVNKILKSTTKGTGTNQIVLLERFIEEIRTMLEATPIEAEQQATVAGFSKLDQFELKMPHHC